jgi:hypothetical protein
MPNKTGQQLVDDARSRSGYQNSGFVTDAEVLNWVNDECIALRDLIVQQDESVYSKPYGFALPDPVLQAIYTTATLGTAPLNFAALPDDFDRAQGLDQANAQGAFNTAGGGPAGARPTTVHMFNFQQRNDLEGPRYKLFGRIAETEILMVMPEENSAGSYRLWYVPHFVPLTLATSLDSIMERFNRYISVGAAIRILAKAKRDASALMQDQARVASAVQTMSNNRDSEAEQGGTDGQMRQRWPYYFGR